MQSEKTVHQTHEVKQSEQTTCCIVGGGPAGAILALLLARKGVRVMLLEAHMDFDRDFRGDTIHPSVLQILDEIGLADRLLQIRHTEMREMSFQTPGGTATIALFSRLKTKYPYIALIPQVEFLKFITEEAKRYPEFRLVMGAQVDDLIEEGGKVCGVRYRGKEGRSEMRAVMTIGADGRFSRVRKLAGFEPIKTSPPMDILWFRLLRRPDDTEQAFGHIEDGRILVALNRFDYWQLGYVIPKGTYQQVRAAGLEQLRQVVARIIPAFADRAQEIREWNQVSVLSVESSCLRCWYRPGLLLIGDAAHVMSPVGGVGINYAIQDAVVAANILGNKLKYGIVQQRDLAKIQRQRELPTRVIQAIQSFLQQNALLPGLKGGTPIFLMPFMRTLLHVPFIRDMPARIVAFGLWPTHVKE